MDTTVTKSDFIKFNVSPTFKALVTSKAKQRGLTLSELGRLLFGAFANDLLAPHSVDLINMADKAQVNFKQGKGKTFANIDDATDFLDQLH